MSSMKRKEDKETSMAKGRSKIKQPSTDKSKEESKKKVLKPTKDNETQDCIKKDERRKKQTDKNVKQERRGKSLERDQRKSKSSSSVGPRSKKAEERNRTKQSSTRQKREQFNLLVLGQTGVGKSTFINGIINYMMFENFNDAVKKGPLDYAPTKFAVTTADYETIEIEPISSDNLGTEVSDSQTQYCKSYVLKYKNTKIRIIDTPGIGDTRGIDQDRINVQNILYYIRNLKELHGILILLKPNESRINLIFKFCLQELVRLLHKNALKNLIFCFTNARSTRFTSGGTSKILETCLKDMIPDFTLTNDLCYFFDNESYRYLASRKSVKYTKEEKEIFHSSWNESKEEMDRMLNFIETLKPHKIKYTASLNDARRIILTLSELLTEITKNITRNREILKNYKSQRKENRQTKERTVYQKSLKSVDSITYRCTNDQCKRKLEKSDSKENQKKYCHKIKNVSNSREWNLKSKQSCDKCKCALNMHIEKLKYKEENSKHFIKDEDIEPKLLELKKQERIIIDATAQFGQFLKRNAFVQNNDAIASYLFLLISEEKQKIRRNRGSKKVLKTLEKTMVYYKTESERIEKSTQQKTDTTLKTPEDVMNMIKKLGELEDIGEQFKSIMKEINKIESKKSRLDEIHVRRKKDRQV